MHIHSPTPSMLADADQRSHGFVFKGLLPDENSSGIRELGHMHPTVLIPTPVPIQDLDVQAQLSYPRSVCNRRETRGWISDQEKLTGIDENTTSLDPGVSRLFTPRNRWIALLVSCYLE